MDKTKCARNEHRERGKTRNELQQQKNGTSERGRVELTGKQQTTGTRRGEKKAMKGLKKIKNKNGIFKRAIKCISTETYGCGVLQSATHHTFLPPCLLYIPSVSLSFCFAPFLTPPPPPIPVERAPRQCLEATVLRNDGLGRGCMQTEGVAEHCGVA